MDRLLVSGLRRSSLPLSQLALYLVVYAMLDHLQFISLRFRTKSSVNLRRYVRTLHVDMETSIRGRPSRPGIVSESSFKI